MGTGNTPRVSIGLPVYNGAKFLAKTLDSLLAQTFTDFELIISDNGSTDATPDICRAYAEKDSRIRYYRTDVNRGAAWNFNNAFRLSQGQYFKWAAHDDLQLPTFLEACVKILEENPSTVLCFSRIMFIDDAGNEIGEYKHDRDLWAASRNQRFLYFTSARHINIEVFGVIRADLLRKSPLIGGYVGSDFVLLAKLALFGPFYQVPECLFLHREHAGRSVIASKGAKSFTTWYDSSKSSGFVMPHWRRLFECAKTVFGHPMPLGEKLACLWEIVRAANWNREYLARDFLYVLTKSWKQS